MPWTFILYGVVLPFSFAGLALAVFASFKMQRLSHKSIALSLRERASALQALQAQPQWRGYRRVMWAGLMLVTGPIVLLMATLVVANARHITAPISPLIALPLFMVPLFPILANSRQRTQMLADAGIKSGTFSVENIRKLEALKQTPEWRKLSREALIMSVFVLAGALVYGALVWTSITGGHWLWGE